jgi:hypothetical protein
MNHVSALKMVGKLWQHELLRKLLIVALMLVGLPVASWPQQSCSLQVTVLDADGNQVPDARISVRLDGREIFSAVSMADGTAQIPGIPSATYNVLIEKAGFQPTSQNVALTSQEVAAEFTLLPKIERSESVEVRADAGVVEQQSTSSSASLRRDEMKSLPNQPATVADALPLIPGVVRSADGQIVIDGEGEHKSAFVVNGTDVTEPATGRFGLTVPVDSVESLEVLKTPFLAEYGRFTAGVVAVETRRGGEKWHFGINDPFPEFRIRSWHLRGLRNLTPRVNFEGPILSNRFYFAEGFEYRINKAPIRTLAWPHNESKTESTNSFSQFDYMISANQFLTGTVQNSRQDTDFENLSYFNPQPVSPGSRDSERLFALTDHLALGATLLTSTLSIQRFGARIGAHGDANMVLTPVGNTGNYFRRETRDESRLQWIEAVNRPVKTRLGMNDLKFGLDVARTNDSVETIAHPVEIRDAHGRLLKQITFVGGTLYAQRDIEWAIYGQDHWLIAPRFALDLGMRLENQLATHALRFAPRAGFAWTPEHGGSLTIRVGFGVYYDRVPLNVYSFPQGPQQVITTYGPGGVVVAGPERYLNLAELQRGNGFPLVYRYNSGFNFAPYSKTWNIEVERTVLQMVRLRINYLESISDGLITITPRISQNQYAYLLGGQGRSTYRQLEVTSRLRWAKSQEMILSYVRSRSRGNLNEFSRYLGDFPSPIIPPDQFSLRPEDLPNRILARASLSLPWRFSIYPIVEYRTGFPYAVVDASRNYVGAPYSDRHRLPSFFSADARIAKDVPFREKYTLRFSVSGFNLTNHFNPIDVHNNVNDPLYGVFFGNGIKKFRGDFEVLF